MFKEHWFRLDEFTQLTNLWYGENLSLGGYKRVIEINNLHHQFIDVSDLILRDPTYHYLVKNLILAEFPNILTHLCVCSPPNSPKPIEVCYNLIYLANLIRNLISNLWKSLIFRSWSPKKWKEVRFTKT